MAGTEVKNSTGHIGDRKDAGNMQKRRGKLEIQMLSHE